jgi:hypothetical protein
MEMRLKRMMKRDLHGGGGCNEEVIADCDLEKDHHPDDTMVVPGTTEIKINRGTSNQLTAEHLIERKKLLL